MGCGGEYVVVGTREQADRDCGGDTHTFSPPSHMPPGLGEQSHVSDQVPRDHPLDPPLLPRPVALHSGAPAGMRTLR